MEVVMIAGGAAMNILGQYKEQKAMQKQLAEDEMRAGIAARHTRQKGEMETRAINRRTQEELGRVKSAFAGSGLRVAGRSYGGLSAKVQYEGDIEQMKSSMRTTAQAEQYEYAAGQARQKKRWAKKNWLWGAGASLLGAGTQLYSLGYSRGWFGGGSGTNYHNTARANDLFYG